MPRPIRVLIVDDSALVRKILARGLAMDPGLDIVGTATDPFDARDKIVKHRPDVLTLDVEMPKMDGVEFLKRLMPQYPLPVVMVSKLTEKGGKVTMDALEAGAVDFVAKPSADMERGLNIMLTELSTKIKIASTANVAHWKHKRTEIRPALEGHSLSETTDKIIAIGASTGGTEAIREVISRFPVTTPGTLIVQHMPPGFTRIFSERMNALCDMEVREAEHGDRVMSGRVLIAPGDKHMKLARSGGIYKVDVKPGPDVCGHCPSVEVMMRSVATCAGANAVGAILTGMGRDGADGLKAMRDSGAGTIAQDEDTSVVFGMPKEAWLRGGAERLVPITDMAGEILNLL